MAGIYPTASPSVLRPRTGVQPLPAPFGRRAGAMPGGLGSGSLVPQAPLGTAQPRAGGVPPLITGAPPPTGGGDHPPTPSGQPLPPTPAPPTTPNYRTLGPFAGKLSAYDTAKFNDPYDQWSEKYRIGAVQSHFDPNQGITPDLLAALNNEQIFGAQFSGGRDKLNVTNAGNYDRFGTGGESDVVGNFNAGNGSATWLPWYVAPQATAAPAPTNPYAPPTATTPTGTSDLPPITINNPSPPGMDPGLLSALLAMFQPQSASGPTVLQQGGSNQAAPSVAPQALQLLAQNWGGGQAGQDPMTAWLTQMMGGAR